MKVAELLDRVPDDRLDELVSLFRKPAPPAPLKPFRVVRSAEGRTSVVVDGVPYMIISVADAKTRHSDRFTDAFKVVTSKGQTVGDFPSYGSAVSFLRNPGRP